MMLFIVESIEKEIKKYTEAYALHNRAPDLAVGFICHINEEDKECLLSDVDKVLPYGMTFSHTYENGKLNLIIKEVDLND